MTIPTLKKINSESDDLNRVQDNVGVSLNAIAKLPLVNYILVEDQPNLLGANGPPGMPSAFPLTITNAGAAVIHKLGRRPVGWIVVSPNADARVWEDTTVDNPDPTKLLYLKSSDDVTLKLLVF